jgi:hypothetical protein
MTTNVFIFDGSEAALAEAKTLQRMTYLVPRYAARRGRFTKMTYEVTVYEDSCHVVTKVRLEGGALGTLVKERQFDGFYRNQMMTIQRNGDVNVIEFERN